MPTRYPLYATAAGVLLALVLATPAAAKISYFSVELEPDHPIAGEPITVTVRFWEDAAHSQPATWGPPHGSVQDLLAFVPADGDRADWIFVPLEPAGEDTLRGTVTVPSSGRWTLTTWPNDNVELPAGYPDPVVVDVSTAIHPAPLAAGAVGIASLVALMALAVRRRARR